jgi:uncharacterized protein (TIRG00374 family)
MRRANLILSALLAAFFFWLAARRVSLQELAAALAAVHFGWLAVAVVVSILIMLFRTWRWQLELRPLEHVPFARLWVVTAVAYMAIQLLPARAGEIVRPLLLARRSGVSASNVVGNLVVEKTVDAIVLLFYMLAGLLMVQNLPSWARRGALFPAAVALLMTAVVVLLWLRGETFVDRWLLRLFPSSWSAGIKRVAAAIVAGMRVLPNPTLLAAVFAVSVALWFLPILSSYLTILAFGFDLPFSAAVAVFILIGFGTAIPNLPGMIGPFQYACVLALGLFGVGESEALAFGLVLNAIQFLTLIAQGLVALPFAGVRFAELRSDLREARAPAEPPTA